MKKLSTIVSSPLLPSFTPDHTVDGVNNHIPSIVLFIDQAIEEHEQELVRLRKARADLVHVPDRTINNKVIQIPANQDGTYAGKQPSESIGDLMLEALRVKGSLTVKEIHQWIIGRGKLAKYHTVSSFVNYYLRKKYIKRVAYGTYSLGEKSSLKGAPKPKLTNGAPLPRNGAS